MGFFALFGVAFIAVMLQGLWHSSLQRSKLRGLRVVTGAEEQVGGAAISLRRRSDFAVILHLMIAALQQGSSLPHCLVHVAQALPSGSEGSDSYCLLTVAHALNTGVAWDAAWSCTKYAVAREHLHLLKEALAAAWLQGSSPIGRLEALAHQLMNDEEARLEVGASRLSVRLLIPTGICFLPAFILMGVIPSVAAFGGGITL